MRQRPKVKRLVRKLDTKRLVRALRYHDYVSDSEGRLRDLGASVRRDAALALATVPDTDEVDAGLALIESLGDQSGEVRRAVAQTLAARGEDRAVAMLARTAIDGDPRYASAREAAGDALVELTGESSADTFVSVVVSEGDDLELAERILDRMIEAGGDDATRGALAAATRALSVDGPQADRSAEILVSLGPDGVMPLINTLTPPNRAQLSAVTALGRLRDRRSSEMLAALLTDDDPAIRSAAAQALGKIADRRVAPELMKATDDPEYSVRAAALEALESLGQAALWAEAEEANGVAMPPQSEEIVRWHPPGWVQRFRQ